MTAFPVAGGPGRRLGLRALRTGTGKRVVWLSEGATQRTFSDSDRREYLRAWKLRHPKYRVVAKAVEPWPGLVLDTDTAWPRPEVCRALVRVSKRLGRKLFIREGTRTPERQQDLYDDYRRRGYAPPIVAVPGTSNHESGWAADVGVNPLPGDRDGVSLRDYPGGEEAARLEGLGFPVPSEAWHTELLRRG